MICSVEVLDTKVDLPHKFMQPFHILQFYYLILFILFAGQDKLTGDITRLAGQVPPAMQAVAGPQMGELLRKGLHMYQKKTQENMTEI